VAAFADSVNPRAFKVDNPPDYIFLCGGKMDDPLHSLRERFYQLRVIPDPVLSKRVKLAEDAFKWPQVLKHFDDLLELEEHLAGLSACILLVVEGPGAIAELGAFSQIQLLKDKLIVVVDRHHFKQQSFIRDGPVEQMRRLKIGRVLSYPWLAESIGRNPREIDPSALNGSLDDLVEQLRSKLASLPRSVRFRPEDHGHRMLLIADLVKLSVIILQSEIQEVLKAFDITLDGKSLGRYLYLLAQLGLIATETYGRLDYYFSVKGAPDYIRYAPKTPADRFELRRMLRNDYPLGAEKERALKAFGLSPLGVTP
jgi:hypothetical protein